MTSKSTSATTTPTAQSTTSKSSATTSNSTPNPQPSNAEPGNAMSGEFYSLHWNHYARKSKLTIECDMTISEFGTELLARFTVWPTGSVSHTCYVCGHYKSFRHLAPDYLSRFYTFLILVAVWLNQTSSSARGPTRPLTRSHGTSGPAAWNEMLIHMIYSIFGDLPPSLTGSMPLAVWLKCVLRKKCGVWDSLHI